MRYVFLLLTGFLLVTSCRFIGGKRIRGNGDLTTEARHPGDFDGVAGLGSYDIFVSTADEYSVKVEAEENLLQYIETNTNGNTLEIKTRRRINLKPRRHIKIFVTAPRYSSLSSSGSGNIRSENLITSSDKLELQISGSGNITVEANASSVEAQIAGSGNIFVSGTAKKFESSIMGSGKISAANLKAEDGKVEIAGSGNVEVYATNLLDIHIMGSGGVRYYGNAKTSTSIAGSGTVRKAD